jgi:hypothetical protein
MIGYVLRGLAGKSTLRKALQKHFEGVQLGEMVTTAREFPIISRVDVQMALDQMFENRPATRLLGINAQMLGHQPPTLAHLFAAGPFPMDVGPLQHDEVDIGDPVPVRCLNNGLWLSKDHSLPFAVLLGPSMSGGVHVEIGVSKGEQGAQFSQEFFRDLELRVGAGRTYRGRVISLEGQHNYLGRGGAVKVHRLRTVKREDVILPLKTLKLLDRNVGDSSQRGSESKRCTSQPRKGSCFTARREQARHTPSTISRRSCLNTPPCLSQPNRSD